MQILQSKTNFYKFMTVSVALMLFYSQLTGGGVHFMSESEHEVDLVSTVNASEIYPMFICPCCGQPLDKEEPCCGSMIDMINFIDESIASGLLEDEVILETARQYGLERLTNDTDRLALKQKLIELAPEDSPKIELSEMGRDLGTVRYGNGVVTSDFELINEGESDLVIDRLTSSCGCTSGAIVYKGVVGPKFTMPGHGEENPEGWSVSISPGDTAILRVYYDPSIHPDLEGAVTRTVSVMSNDPVDFEKQVTITLEQVK